MTRFAPLLAAALLIVGCGPATRSYTISVKNDSPEPMTVWLTKDGPPIEAKWLSPEQIAVMGKSKDDPISGVVIPPGKTGEMGPIDGRFEPGANAVLRVYRGQKLFNDLLAISAGSPGRTDLRLAPGTNAIVIDAGGNALRN
jgi:hypothetical protein